MKIRAPFIILMSFVFVGCVSTNKLNKVSSEQNTKISIVEYDLKQLNSSIISLETNINTLEKQNKNDVSLLKDEIKVLNDKLDNLKTLVNQLRIEVAHLKNSVPNKLLNQ